MKKEGSRVLLGKGTEKRSRQSTVPGVGKEEGDIIEVKVARQDVLK